MLDLFTRDKWLADIDPADRFVCHQGGGGGGGGGGPGGAGDTGYNPGDPTVNLPEVVVNPPSTADAGTFGPGGPGWGSGVTGSGSDSGLTASYGVVAPGGFGTSTGADFAARFAPTYHPGRAMDWNERLNSRFGFPNDISAPRGVYSINPNRLGNPYGPGLSPAFVQSLQPPTRGDFPPLTPRGDEPPPPPPSWPVTPTVRGTTPTPTPTTPVADPRGTTPHGPADRGADDSYAVQTFGAGGDNQRVRDLNTYYSGMTGAPENIREYVGAIYGELASNPSLFQHIMEQGLTPEDIANEIQRPIANLGIGGFDSPEIASINTQLHYGEGQTPGQIASGVLASHGINMATGETFGEPTAANTQMGGLARGPWSGI